MRSAASPRWLQRARRHHAQVDRARPAPSRTTFVSCASRRASSSRASCETTSHRPAAAAAASALSRGSAADVEEVRPRDSRTRARASATASIARVTTRPTSSCQSDGNTSSAVGDEASGEVAPGGARSGSAAARTSGSAPIGTSCSARTIGTTSSGMATFADVLALFILPPLAFKSRLAH